MKQNNLNCNKKILKKGDRKKDLLFKIIFIKEPESDLCRSRIRAKVVRIRNTSGEGESLYGPGLS